MVSIRTRGERLREATTLAAVGGYLDAYTYLAHGGVFANAQTGNVILGSIAAVTGHVHQALRHVWPLLAFAAGVVAVEVLARHRTWPWVRRPTRVVLLAECVVFVVVGLLPSATPDIICTVAIAFVSTMQVCTFRQLGDLSYNTTFTTGNLRTLFAQASAWLMDHDAAAAARARDIGAVVISFAVGAVLGALATSSAIDRYAVLLVVPALLTVLVSVVRGTRGSSDDVRRSTGDTHSPGLT